LLLGFTVVAWVSLSLLLPCFHFHFCGLDFTFVALLSPNIAFTVVLSSGVWTYRRRVAQNWKRKGYQKVLEKRGGGGGGGMGVFFVGAALVGLFFALPHLKEARQKLFWKRESLSQHSRAANSNTRHR
jgi:hypothetical protein